MELTFDKQKLSFLGTPVREIQNTEVTQELKLSDGSPDVGRILCAWGQSILRTKEWRMDSVLITGGVMVWVLYMPEEAQQARSLNAWVPFQIKLPLPDGTPEGKLQADIRLRTVDARMVSARKLMLRCAVGAYVCAIVPQEAAVSVPGDVPPEVSVLRTSHAVRLLREAGEKAFYVEEELDAPAGGKLIYYTLCPEAEEQKLMADKLAFHGSARLHVLFMGEDGEPLAQDYPLAFSQYAEMEREYGSDAQALLLPQVTELEAETDGEGRLHVRAGLLAQYAISEPVTVECAQDAYSLTNELTLQDGELMLPEVAPTASETVPVQATVQAQGSNVADTQLLPDFPRLHDADGGAQALFTGTVQALYHGEDGALRCAAGRFEIERMLSGDAEQTVLPQCAEDVQIGLSGGNLDVRFRLPVRIYAQTVRKIPMLTGLTVGQERTPDPSRPSVLVRRSCGESVWELAKRSGSTPEAIRRANALEGEPTAGQLLLIPVL